MSSPFFSVVIPTYNRAHMLGKAIDSVLAQEYGDWELLIIDDGSTDGTRELVSSYPQESIRYLYQENQGRGAARNLGIEHARGQYICFLDSDDYYLPSHLGALKKAIDSHGHAQGIYYTNTYEDNHGTLEKVADKEVKARSFLEYILVNSIGVPRTCLPAAVLRDHRFDPALYIAEDIELWSRILLKSELIHIPEYTVVYRNHDDRTVDIHDLEKIREHIRVVRQVLKRSGEKVSFQVRSKLISGFYYYLSRVYHTHKNGTALLKAAALSLLLEPGNKTREKLYMMKEALKMILSL